MTLRVLGVGNTNTTQTDHRSLITSLTQPSTSLAHRGGLFPTNLPAGLTNVSSMVVGIGNFKGIVPNTAGTGYYLVQNDAQIQLTFDPGEAGVTRTDRIIVRVYNNPQDGSGQETVAVEYLKGQSSGSASTLPANSLLLWEVPVPAGASSGGGGINFTSIAVDKRVYTTASGGIMPIANNTDLNAVSNPFEGMAAFVRATDILYIYDGSLWRPKGQISVANVSGLSNILNPEDGTIAVVRDTDTIFTYNGTNWLRNSGKFVGETVRISQVGPFTSETVIDSYTFSAVAGESYRIVWGGSVQSSVINDNIIVKMRWIAGSSITGSTGTVVRLAYPNANVNGKGQMVSMEKVITPNITGNVTVAATALRGTGTGQITSYGNAGQQENVLQVFVA